MLFGSILKKYSADRSRRKILSEMIQWLRIDSIQKQLFLDSVEVLDSNGIESLYIKITNFVVRIEEQDMMVSMKNRQSFQTTLENSEKREKENEKNSFNILFDSI